MTKKALRLLMIVLLLIGFGSSGLAQELAKKERVIKRVEKERAEFKKLMIQNPNYFGTFPELKLKAVKPMKYNTKYEELRCLGFYPEQDLLEAIVDVKLSYGYKGDLCSAGSFEYVRFFADWNNDGDFEDADEDAGITSVNVHDIDGVSTTCLDKTKPLSYALTLKIDPEKRVCTFPKLVKVRAILSWNTPPTEGNPDYSPVWGNVLETWIQIEPRTLSIFDITDLVKMKEFYLVPDMLKLDLPITMKKELSRLELKEIYQGKDVPEHRFDFKGIHKKLVKIKQDPDLVIKYQLDPKFSDIIKDYDLIFPVEYNTRYEQLYCLGLDYDLHRLVATFEVKLPYGYNGDLCTKGSNEYVAFWVYAWDQIEQQCIWKYLGTASVNVHDIPSIPPEGLEYAVYLPVDFSNYRDICSNPKVLKVRGILSWEIPPPSNDPDYIPTWGNKIDALIQIKPGDPVAEGEQIPFISVVGGMAIENISGNTHTVLPSAIGAGYANGTSVYGGYTALESPFGGVVAICGHISNPPDDPIIAGTKLEYKVQYRGSDGIWHDITNKFKIWISTWNGFTNTWSMSHKWQIPVNGYFEYEEDLEGEIQHFVEGNVFAQWHTPVPEGDGLYDVRALLFKHGAPYVPGVPADHISSNVVKVRVDNTKPDPVELTLDSGPCEEFTPGSVITGKFKAVDLHFWRYNFSVAPYSPPSGQFTHVPVEKNYPLLSAPGVTGAIPPDGTFELNTAGMTPCGYVIYLHVWDRAILNNHMQGNRGSASVGFCLLKE